MRSVRKYVVSVVLVAIVASGLVGITLAKGLRPKLGLDLRGGLSVILTAPAHTRTDVLNKTLEVLRNRVDRAGVAEPEISREGSNNILIQLPGVGDPQRLLKLVGRTAQLEFRQVNAELVPGGDKYESTQVSAQDDPKQPAVLAGTGKSPIKYQLAAADLTGSAVHDATAVIDTQNGAWHVVLRFNSDGAKKWQAFTGRLACLPQTQTAGSAGPTRDIAIVLDGEVQSAPGVAAEVQCGQGIANGDTQITGSGSERASRDLALVLTTGALPVSLTQSEVRTVSATLGKESLRAGLAAGGLGLVLVFLYVLIYYRALGLQTWLGLMTFSSIIYGLVVLLGAAIGWSLTLAGVAGLIVSIGIATDSYIVFFERVKEEVHEGRTLRTSMDRGFGAAWRTLRTANTVTILAALILYLLAVGPVRGFALALGMATTLDLIIFASLTWPLAALLARSRFFAEGKFIGMRRALEGGKEGLARKIYRSEFNIDFVGRRVVWLSLSGILVAVSAIGLVPGVRGLKFGIDFKGGDIFRAEVQRKVKAADFTAALRKAGQPGAVVGLLKDQTSGKTRVQVQTEVIHKEADRDLVIGAISQTAGVPTSSVDIEAVGEKWGGQITTKALRGLAIFLGMVILYMSWRLEPKMAAAGIAALIHDLVITAGIYAIVGFQVSPATVIAILTILGYSLYDTVVVFDKIRENISLPSNSRKSFGQIANESSNQVLMRSINTSLTTLLPVGSLLFVGSFLLGADTLKDLALALFVGIAAGTYSSIFVATPLLSFWKEREPRYASIRAKAIRGVAVAGATAGGGSAAVVTAASAVGEEAPSSPAQVPSPNGPKAPPRGPRTQQKRKSRSKRKGARR